MSYVRTLRSVRGRLLSRLGEEGLVRSVTAYARPTARSTLCDTMACVREVAEDLENELQADCEFDDGDVLWISVRHLLGYYDDAYSQSALVLAMLRLRAMGYDVKWGRMASYPRTLCPKRRTVRWCPRDSLIVKKT